VEPQYPVLESAFQTSFTGTYVVPNNPTNSLSASEASEPEFYCKNRAWISGRIWTPIFCQSLKSN